MTFPDDENPLEGGQEPPEHPEELSAFTTGESDSSDNQVPPFPAEGGVLPEFDFPRMDEDLAAFRRELDDIQLAPISRLSEDEPIRTNSSRRRRRVTRIVKRPDVSELGDRLESIAHRAAPTFDFFVFSILCGGILGIGYILDAPAILLMGILLAPVLAPWVGVAMAAATGEVRFFGQTLGGFLTALVMVFAVGLLSGLASRIFQPLTFSQAFLHSRLWWPDLLVLAIGTIILAIAFIQSEDKPVLSSLMVAYEICLPVSAAGFGLGSGIQGIWPGAGLVFLIHLALSLIISLIVFFYMGFRPLEAGGYALTVGIGLVGLVVVVGFAGLGSLINIRSDRVENPVPSVSTPTVIVSPIVQSTYTPFVALQPTATRLFVTPTVGFTPSPTLLPTPIYGRVQSHGDGAIIRTEPGGAAITTIQNGYLVEILGDAPIILEGTTWVHVIVKTPSRDIDGWVLVNLIVTATPSGSP